MPEDEGPEAAPAGGRSGGAGGTTARRSLAGVGDRVQEILDDAERAAEEIRAEAEEIRAAAETASAEYLAERRREADRLVEERLERLGELTESLSAQAASVEREASVLAAEVSDAVGRLKAVDAGSVTAISATAGDGVSEQAVLRATQMAVTGADRAEIEKTLREDFEIANPGPIVDQLLDRESA
jgi:hypothetical protein